MRHGTLSVLEMPCGMAQDVVSDVITTFSLMKRRTSPGDR
jgi:hypothetical protein